MTRHISRSFGQLLILLFFIVVAETVNVNLIHFSSETINPNYIVYPLCVLQIVFATLQAGLSDYYSRKKCLIFSIFIIILSLSFFALSHWKFQAFFLALFILFLGMGGNLMPISLAALGDITEPKQFRFILGVAIAAIALGSFGPLNVDNYISDGPALRLTFTLVILAFFLALFIPSEPVKRFHESFSLKKECYLIYSKFLKNRFFLLGLLGFFLAEVSFYQIYLRGEAMSLEILKFVPIKMGIAYFIGTFFLKFTKASDGAIIYRGFWISLVSVFILTVNYFVGLKMGWFSEIFTLSVMGFGLGYSLFTPSIFSLISRNHEVHDYGKIFGLLDSTDTAAVIFSLILINLFSNVNVSSVFLISFFVMICAGVIFHITIRGNHEKSRSLHS